MSAGTPTGARDSGGRAGAGRGRGLRGDRRDPHVGDGTADQGDPPGPPPRGPAGQPLGGPCPRTGLGTRQRAGRGSLAAPSFVEACLLRPSHAIELAGIDFAVVKLAVDSRENMHDTFRGQFGHLAPVAIMPSGGEPMEQCPGRDHPCTSGTASPSWARWTSCGDGHFDDPAGRRPDAVHRAGAPRPAAGRHCARRGQPGPGGGGHGAVRADCDGHRRAALHLPSRRGALPPRLPLLPCTSPWRPWRPSATATTASRRRARG